MYAAGRDSAGLREQAKTSSYLNFYQIIYLSDFTHITIVI